MFYILWQLQRCVEGIYYQRVEGYDITLSVIGERLSKISVRGKDTSNGPYLSSITITYYAIVSLHNINYKRGGFISNEIYFAAWYPQYNDEILSMNRNICNIEE